MNLWSFDRDENSFDPKNIEEDFNLLEQELKDGNFYHIKRERILLHVHYFMSAGKYSQAHKLLDLLEGYNSPLPQSEVYLLRSAVYSESGKKELAIVYISKAIKFEPDNFELYFTKGVYLLDWKKLDLALNSFRKSFMLSVDPRTTAYDIAEVLMEKHHYKKALPYLLIAYMDNDFRLPAMKDIVICHKNNAEIEKGISFVQRHLERFPDDANAWQILAEAYFHANEYDKAIEALRMRLAISHNIKSHLNLAEVLIQLNEPYDALKELKRCRIANPAILKNNQYYLLKGLALKKLGKYQEAANELKKILSAVPQVAKFIAECYIKLNQPKLAREYAQKLYETNQIEGERAKALVALAKNDIVLAIKHASKYLTVFEPEAEEWAFWAEQLAKYGFYQEAINLLNMGIPQVINKIDLTYQKIAYLIKDNKIDDAIAELENALLEDYEKHGILFHYYPELQNLKLFSHIINKYK